MNIKVYSGKLKGTVRAIPSKSQAHRYLICAALSDTPTAIICAETNQDLEATVRCLNAIGANIIRTDSGYYVDPIKTVPSKAVIDCGESGSTLRFMLPLVCALGIECNFILQGRLPYRPLSPLWEELERMGCTLTRAATNAIHAKGKLMCGDYYIDGNVSSQFITGLLFALSLLDGKSQIHILGKLESRDYITMTQRALEAFGVFTDDYITGGNRPFRSPGHISVEGDWSNAAFFLAAKYLGSDLSVENLDPSSHQGDAAVLNILESTEHVPLINAADIPDLVPILAVYFAARNGAVFTNTSRLRLKESDRVASVINLLKQLGIHAEADQNTLTVTGGTFSGGTVDTYGDHRIAMAAAIASTVASGPVYILGAECVAKSYPSFWKEFQRLGGKYE